MNLHLTDDDLVLHYYGELPAPDESRAESHLAACAPAVEPAPGFERIVWARLEPALQRPGRGWLAWFVFSPARLAFTAGVVMLIGAAFMAGRMTRSAAPAAGAGAVVQTAETVRERILLVDLGEHLDRSQMV